MGLQVWLNFLVDDRAGPVWLNYRQQYTTILEKSTDENKHGMMSIEEHRKLIKNRENRMNNGNTRTYQVQVSPAKQTATRQRGEEAEYVVPQSSLNLVSSFLTFTFLTTFSPSSHSPLPPPLLTTSSDRIPLSPAIASLAHPCPYSPPLTLSAPINQVRASLWRRGGERISLRPASTPPRASLVFSVGVIASLIRVARKQPR